MTDKGAVRIHVAMKHPGNLTKKVKIHSVPLTKTPGTFRALIEETVRACIDSYRRHGSAAGSPSPLTEEQYAAMQELGKFAFDVHYNENTINEDKAIGTALEAVTDGLVRVFQGDRELTDLSCALEINEDDVFTFIRMTMLSGRMW